MTQADIGDYNLFFLTRMAQVIKSS